MKKLIGILSVLLVVFFVSCSSDNGGNNNGGTDDEGGSVDKSANLLATGASANDILSNTNFDRLLIEIGFVTGFRPTQEAMANFQDYLRTHTFKDNIDIVYNELQSPDEQTLTLQEIADLEEENRTAYNDGTTLAIYIYFADAPSDDDDQSEGSVTLGAVYRNTSMVIFEGTIRSLAARSLTITNEDVETVTLNHEFGHLFGLVNLGTVAVNDHEDPDAVNHCVVEGCLMQAELQFSSSNKNGIDQKSMQTVQSPCLLSGNSVMHLLNQKTTKSSISLDLDAECVLDIQNNGGR